MRKCILLLSMLIPVFLVPALAQDYYRFKLPGDSEPIYATWVNEEIRRSRTASAKENIYELGLWRIIQENH